jgi:hypothetical protein
MDSKNDLANVSAASERFFRLYHAHCVSPDRDTLFSLLEAGHSPNDRLRTGADLDFFDVPEFTVLKCRIAGDLHDLFGVADHSADDQDRTDVEPELADD